MSDHPFAYYDPTHDKLLWAEGPSYVHAQRTEGMSLKPLYLHRPRPEPARPTMSEEEPIAWIPEDELSESYPYDLMFQYSKVDIIRWFPVYGPPTKTAPMTEEEIIDVCRAVCENFRWPSSAIDCIRRAEEFHGIGRE